MHENLHVKNFIKKLLKIHQNFKSFEAILKMLMFPFLDRNSKNNQNFNKNFNQN